MCHCHKEFTQCLQIMTTEAQVRTRRPRGRGRDVGAPGGTRAPRTPTCPWSSNEMKASGRAGACGDTGSGALRPPSGRRDRDSNRWGPRSHFCPLNSCPLAEESHATLSGSVVPQGTFLKASSVRRGPRCGTWRGPPRGENVVGDDRPEVRGTLWFFPRNTDFYPHTRARHPRSANSFLPPAHEPPPRRPRPTRPPR